MVVVTWHFLQTSYGSIVHNNSTPFTHTSPLVVQQLTIYTCLYTNSLLSRAIIVFCSETYKIMIN